MATSFLEADAATWKAPPSPSAASPVGGHRPLHVLRPKSLSLGPSPARDVNLATEETATSAAADAIASFSSSTAGDTATKTVAQIDQGATHCCCGGNCQAATADAAEASVTTGDAVAPTMSIPASSGDAVGEKLTVAMTSTVLSPTMSPTAAARPLPSPVSRKRLHTLRIQTDFSESPALSAPPSASPRTSSPRMTSPSRTMVSELTLEDLMLPTSASAIDLPALAQPSADSRSASPRVSIATEYGAGIGLSASLPPKRASVANVEGSANPVGGSNANTPVHRPKPHPFSLADFFYKEIFGVHDVKPTDGQHQERVQNFFTVPLSTEQLFAFGVLLALDSFLYVFTYLPLRILFACGCAVSSSFRSTRVFRRTHFYDLMVAVIVSVGTYVLWHVDMSRVYHAIRGQAMIKLYVLFTMIEIFDKLFSSLGQDVLDSLYYTAKYQPRRVIRMFCDFAVAIIYVDILSTFLHSLLLFAQVVTINVAINSSNTSLLTLLISNNFAELKSSVFKKFEEQNLFQISCSDIVERFKLVLIIGLILLQSNAQDVVYGTTMVMVAEMLIDWLKHAFITKFNRLPPSLYSKFITILCRDLTGWKNEDTILDHTHHVSRRLGLVSLPLACVVLRTVGKVLRDVPICLTCPSGVLVTLTFFACLAAFKALLSLALMVYACKSGRLDDTRPKSPRAMHHLESIHGYKQGLKG